MSGPLHGGAPARVLPMIEEVERTGDARDVVTGILDRHEQADGLRAPRLPGRRPPRPGTAPHRQASWTPRGSTPPTPSSRLRWPNCGSGGPTAPSRPTSSSGPRSSSTTALFRGGLRRSEKRGRRALAFYAQFLADWRYFFEIEGLVLPSSYEPAHTFACFGRFSAPSSASSSTSSAVRCRRRNCARPCGNPSSRMTCGAIAAPSMNAWANSPRSSPALPAGAKNWWRAPSPNRRTCASKSARMTFPDEDAALFFPSISRRSRPRWWNPDSSAIAAARSPARLADRKGWLETCPPAGAGLPRRVGRSRTRHQVKLLRVIETRRFIPWAIPQACASRAS